MNKNLYGFAEDEKYNCDICVIGAGAAGIALAGELSKARLRVCLVESGDFDFYEETQNLYQGKNTGLPYYNLDECRLRFFGGTTNHWNGLCGPLQADDFQSHSWIRNSGWPINFKMVEKYYNRAQKICELGPMNYSPKDWVTTNPPKFDEEKMELGMWQISPPTRFGERYRGDLRNSNNLRIILNANLTQLIPSSNTRKIISANFQDLSGKKLSVRAGAYVLACGGIENARMLLLSQKYEAAGIGNSKGLVGKYFMEHITWDPATVLLFEKKPDWWKQFEGATNKKFNTDYMLFLKSNIKIRQKLRILNFCFSFYPHYHSLATWSAARLAEQINRGSVEGIFEHFTNILGGIDDIATMVYRRFSNQTDQIDSKKVELLKPIIQLEQAPNESSYVKLSRDRDSMGLNSVSVNWQLSNIDRRTIKTATLLLAEELGRLDLGRLHLSSWLSENESGWPSDIKGGNHHMGTTKMGATPNRGVVDKNCKVFGVENLFISGSSTFPTGGYVNPTLTIVALSLRLADHLKNNYT